MLVVLVAVVWSLRTAPAPNADRYDYLGRAHHVLSGEGPQPLVIYPLRVAFPDAKGWPVENLTRPPLWPMLLAVPLGLGAGDASGVLVAGLCLALLLPLLTRATDRAFGAPAGGFASLALACSFASFRAVFGGGPETALALGTLVLWTWNASGRTAMIGLGALAGLLPWLHPVGWVHAGLALASRTQRTAPRTLAAAALLAIVLGSPWYLHVGHSTGSIASPLQSQAELAKGVEDPGGLGPYLGLTPRSSMQVLRTEPGAVSRRAASNAKDLLFHSRGWMAWPLLLLALVGTRRDPWLAARDLLLGGVALVVLSPLARDPRLLVPLLPILAGWSGAGWQTLHRATPRWAGPLAATAVATAAWWLPLGPGLRPFEELASIPLDQRDPDAATVRALVEVGDGRSPLFFDSAVLAWRARRGGVFVPADPADLEAIAGRCQWLEGDDLLVLTAQTEKWTRGNEWTDWFAAREARSLAGLTIWPLHATERVFVPAPLELGAQDVPDSLVALPVPPASREGLRLRADAVRALRRLLSAASGDGITLRVASAYRSYDYQQRLYSSAVERHGAEQEWVAAPGTSEHQLGTTVDFADAALAHVVEESFAQTKEAAWLAANAHRFGWIRSYTEANAEQTGYRPEPWHYRWYPEQESRTP